MTAPPLGNTVTETPASAAINALRIDPAMKAFAPVDKKRPWVKYGAVVLALAAGVAYFFSPKPIEVTTATASLTAPSAEHLVLTASGYVVAQRRAALATKATGQLVQLNVREGSKVKAGDLLARLDARDVSAQFDAQQAQIAVAQANAAAAKAELKDAEQNLKRSQELVDKQFLSPASLDSAIARQARAKAQLLSAESAAQAAQASARAARVSRDETEIRAPFDGVVITKNANVGDVITPFSNAAESKGAVVTLADLSTLEVEVDVSESNIGKVAVAQPCEILLDALPQERFSGTVSSIVPTVDRAKATVMVKVKFDQLDTRVLPEMSAKVSFLNKAVDPQSQKPFLTVPLTAVREGKVYLIDQGKAREVAVQTGNTVGKQVQINSGLKTGDAVINPLPDTLKNGSPVATAKAK